MKTHACDVAVLGAGPAGLAAACTTAAHGASTLLIDDDPALGGHYYKDLPQTFAGNPVGQHPHKRRELEQARQDLKTHAVQLLQGVHLWGIFQGEGPTFSAQAEMASADRSFHLHLAHPQDGPQSVIARRLILAPGVYDRPLPFPGWDLPGVLTPGAVQMLLEKQGLVPGKRILVAGSGPLQLLVAASLARAGAEVVALLEAGGALDEMTGVPSALGGLWSRFGELLESMLSLAGKRVLFLFRHAVWRATGTPEDGVSGVVIGRVDADGHPIAGTERQLEVDTIVCAYGFSPSIALTQHLDCDHVYDPNLCAFVPKVDAYLQTSQPGVFVAGDVTGVGGKPLAALQGNLAGLSALEQLGRLTHQEVERQRKQLEPAMRREQRFAHWLWRRYRLRLGLMDLADDQTIICRCEAVRLGQLRASLVDGSQDLYGLKLRTRLGMGNCQGRYCVLNAAAWLSSQTGLPVPQLGLATIRPPIIPVRLKDIASVDPSAT